MIKSKILCKNFYLSTSLALLMGVSFTVPATADYYQSARRDELNAKKRLVLQKYGYVQGMQGRFIGPTMGTRGPAVSGHPTNPHVFFHGSAAGGLWKTEDDGRFWEPVGEGQFKMGSIGAIAVSTSNPDVMYVGTGEPNLRDCVSWGDGVYKSIDGGETWKNIGLKKTHHISKIQIHPSNPDLVYVAAIGNPFGPGEDRGVYRSKDGGKNWEKILYKSDVAGANDLMMDETNPDNLYASIYQIQRKTWGLKSGGPDSGLWKSTDGGDTWQDITRNPGLPQEGVLGKIGLALSPAKPERISALIDSDTKSGMYQSNDSGKTWEFLSNEVGIIQRPFYYFHTYASPVNPDELWVLSNKLWQSLDGGKTWTQRSGTKDDFHDMWMDPKDPDRMIIIHDGGAMVSTTHGKTWSDAWTQKTTQFYRVNVDNQYPYNVYGNGQDLIGFKVPSSTVWGGISNNDVTILGTGESGASVPHPEDPNIVYHLAQSSMAAGGGPIQRINLKTMQFEHVNVWPVITFGRGQKDAKYRFNWHAPIVIDPFNSETIYTAAEYVFRSTDRGQNWEIISPELTKDDPSKQEAGGAPWAPETSGQEAYNTIHRMVASTVQEGVLWTGSDDGLVHVSKDGGANWENVSPKLPEDSDVYEIEASPHDGGTAYVAVSRYRTANDFKPYLFKTDDYGKTWKDLCKTFPQEEITRTIREDTVRKGLLFVGTETGIFYSLNDGTSWQRFKMGLPAVPVNDMKIKHEDLVIATMGRGFWIVDDISPLRQQTKETVSTNHLYTPRTAIRYGHNWWAAYGGGVFGGQKNYFVQNHRPGHTFIELGVINGERKRYFLEGGSARPDSAVIYYNLKEGAKDVNLTILDSEGTAINTFSGDELGTSPGLNMFVWDTNYPDAKNVPGKPPAGVVVMAKPGTYKVRLTADGKSQTESFELIINPTEKWTKADTDARFDLWMKIREITENANLAIIDVLDVNKEVQEAAGSMKDKSAVTLAEKISKEAEGVGGRLVPVGKTLSEIANEPAKLLSKLQTVSHMLYSSEGRPPQSAYDVVEDLSRQIDTELSNWNKVMATDVAAFKKMQ